ncbi:hypothetical protein P5673_010150 [Acropora cervicornis]|uniref:Uncharacterized protein n=1 Tax=Acropora cervicornis TaxID=6130 RepID=A0AAD9V941_ACRCE|nr:hypothetical protein P5673_010150 [Acropora cervicornis]
MSPCSLNYWLSKFVQEVNNSSEEHYPSRSLYSIICGLKHNLSDVNGSAALNPLDMTDRRAIFEQNIGLEHISSTKKVNDFVENLAFGSQQESALQDYLEASVVLRYNNAKRV